MANIKKIAELAQVSTCTVSKYLNGKMSIRPETAERIDSVIRELDYVPSQIARSLTTKRTNTVAVIIPEIKSLYYSEIISGIKEELQKKEYAIIIYEQEKTPNKWEQLVKRLIAARVDGVIIIGSSGIYNQEYLNELKRAEISVILTNCVKENSDNSVIGPDYFQAGIMAAEYINRQNYLSPGIVIKNDNCDESNEQLAGFLKKYEDYGKELPNHNILTYENDAELVEKIVSLNKQGLLDALYVVNELMAVDLIKKLSGLSIKIPEEIGLIGFGSTYLGELVTPMLTCLDLHNFKIGFESAKLFLKEMNGGTETESIRIMPELVVRESM